MEEYHEIRFYCDNCGHNFCLEVEEDMPMPKYCIFCGSTIYYREDNEDNYE